MAESLGPSTQHAQAAAEYPPEMVVAIIRGLQAQREEDARAGRTEVPLSKALVQAMELEKPLWSDKVVRDEYTGVPLDPSSCAEARPRS